MMMEEKPLNALEIKGSFILSNGMYCLYGKRGDGRICVDVYVDESKKQLVMMQHRITSNCGIDPEALKDLMETMV